MTAIRKLTSELSGFWFAVNTPETELAIRTYSEGLFTQSLDGCIADGDLEVYIFGRP
jgi:hypothetical protein